jgi:hypothetical protein
MYKGGEVDVLPASSWHGSLLFPLGKVFVVVVVVVVVLF